MTITITAFDRSPDGGQGLARDTRVRWALEEVAQPYEVRLVTSAARTAAAKRFMDDLHSGCVHDAAPAC
jgi:glutathione S-transferase